MADAGTLPGNTFGIRDPEAFARNLARLLEEAGKAASAYLKPREGNLQTPDFGNNLAEVVKTLDEVGKYWLAEPERALEAQNRLFTAYTGLWTASLQRMMGLPAAPFASPDPGDKR